MSPPSVRERTTLSAETITSLPAAESEEDIGAPEKSPIDTSPKNTSYRYMMWLGVPLICHIVITWTLFNVAGFMAQFAFLCSQILVTTVNFVGLRQFVFRATQSSIQHQVVPFIVLNLLFRAGEFFAFEAIYSAAQPSVLIVVPLVLGLSTLVRYFVYKYLVFLVPSQSATRATDG